MSHLTVHYIIKGVCRAIIDNLLAYVMSQQKEKDWENISDEFWKNVELLNYLGSLNGKYMEPFCFSKQWFSIF